MSFNLHVIACIRTGCSSGAALLRTNRHATLDELADAVDKDGQAASGREGGRSGREGVGKVVEERHSPIGSKERVVVRPRRVLGQIDQDGNHAGAQQHVACKAGCLEVHEEVEKGVDILCRRLGCSDDLGVIYERGLADKRQPVHDLPTHEHHSEGLTRAAAARS